MSTVRISSLLGKITVLIVLLSIASVSVIGKTIHVKVGGTGDGSSWANAYGSLQDALDDAELNDSIWVAQGTYKPTELFDPCDPRSATFQMKNNVGIYGGFPGVGDPNWESRDWEKYETVLSGDLLGNDVKVGEPYDLIDESTRGENSYHVVNGSGTNATAILDGFTITAGNANSSSPNYQGGGIYIRGGSPTITWCSVKWNKADHGGGIVCLYSSNPTIANCIIQKNCTQWNGGGIYCRYSSSPIITSSIITNNWSVSTAGGLLFDDNCHPTISKCKITKNSAIGTSYAAGGGLYCNGSAATITDCLISENIAQYDAGGIAIYNKPYLTLKNCVISRNHATYAGGIYCNDTSPAILNCAINSNTASRDGGGIYCSSSGEPKITNCAIVKNMAEGGSYEPPGGGGLYCNRTNPVLSNCVIGWNIAQEDSGGGGILCFNSSHPSLTNCILWGDIAADGNEIALYGSSIIDVNYCDVAGNQEDVHTEGDATLNWGLGNIDEYPLFIDPNGPDNIPGTEDDNLHLLPYSPCIDAGDPTGDYTNQTDIDGEQRVLYDRVDIGADEVFPIAGDIDMDGDVDFNDYAYFTGHWLKGK